jgi:cell division protease FtsH
VTTGVPSPKKPFPVLAVVMPAIGIAAFLALWQFLTPPQRSAPVAYSDFLSDVQAGKVEEIKIHDREIRYRLRSPDGHRIVKETIGPIPDQALIASLKPTDPNAPLPKIVLEK